MTADRYAVALQRVVRDDWSRLASSLVGQFRRIDLVEDALGDAVEAAARTWPRDGIPERPSAWVLTAARRVILDRLRAEAMHRRRRPLLVSDALMYAERTTSRADPGDLVDDDRLRLVLMCTHPALDPDAAAALALRLVLGVSTRDVARLFLVSEPTMAARITRAKRKIVSAAIPFTIPPLHALPGRVETAAGVAYLAFTAGYAPASGSDLVRSEIAGEAIRLVRVMLDLRPGEPVLVALLALMLLQHSRRDARVGPDGELVLLPDQDRSRWHRDEIDEGLALLASLERLVRMVPVRFRRCRVRPRRMPCRPASPPSTPALPRQGTRDGTGSCGSTTRWSTSGPGRVPSWAEWWRSRRRRAHERRSNCLPRSRCLVAIASPPCGPSCCRGAAMRRGRGRHTWKRLRCATTRLNSPFSGTGWRSWRPRTDDRDRGHAGRRGDALARVTGNQGTRHDPTQGKGRSGSGQRAAVRQRSGTSGQRAAVRQRRSASRGQAAVALRRAS